MAKTFKVGDKVRILDVSKIKGGYEHWSTGDITEVTGFFGTDYRYPVLKRNKSGSSVHNNHLLPSETCYIELVDAKPTKKQRIKAIENEVEALKARIEALEKAKEIDISARIAEKKTPNQRRKAVIERAKAFVADVEKGALRSDDMNADLRDGNFTYKARTTRAEYHVNKEKRVVTALIKGANYGRLLEKAIAKCSPGDVFNEHIGKAIALAKAYGLECPKEFTDAPQPEIAVGQVVKDYGDYVDVVVEILDELPYETLVSGEKLSGKAFLRKGTFGWIAESQLSEILDDTEAQYV